MGRACMELWTTIHFVLKIAVVILMAIVEFLVLDWSLSEYGQLLYLEGYYLITFTYLLIVLYGYIWFDSTVILEICMVIASIFMLIFSIIAYTHEHYRDGHHEEVYDTRYAIYKYNRRKFTIFAVLSLVALVLLVIDLVLLLMTALGKTSFAKSSQQQRRHEEN